MKNRVRFFFLFLGLLGALAVHAQINELPRSTPEAEGVPSKAVTALFDSLTVLENVMFPLDMFSDMTYRERVKRAQFCLDRVNLIDAQSKYPGEISGGMQKRVAIARAIALKPQYLFCDEPNSGLDPKTSLVIDELVHDITSEYNMTTIINTHDMNSVLGIGENILYIYQGHKEWEGNKDQVMGSTNERLNSFVFASDLLRKVQEEEKEKLQHK